MYQKTISILLICTLFLINSSFYVRATQSAWWEFQSVDTMKYSRDTSAQYLHDRAELEKISDEQVKNIASLGATHVAIATPYDEEFLPVLETWVAAARKYNLKVWFRGNWSGWEEWFEYPSITRSEHLEKTVAFIESHPDLFENGDYFSACPECENGGPGDPRFTGDISGHRKFLMDENTAMLEAFRLINVNVQVNLNSMNGDVAHLIMDKPTTQALGGRVVIDHYVRTPQELNDDVTEIAEKSGGEIILGEFVAPIPDINGEMTQQEQADWLDESLSLLQSNPHLYGLSYWTNVGGSTALWTESGTPKLAVDVVKKHFTPPVLTGKVVDTLGNPVATATLSTANHDRITGKDGSYIIPFQDTKKMVAITAKNYTSRNIRVDQLQGDPVIVIAPENHGWWYAVRLWFSDLLKEKVLP